MLLACIASARFRAVEYARAFGIVPDDGARPGYSR